MGYFPGVKLISNLKDIKMDAAMLQAAFGFKHRLWFPSMKFPFLTAQWTNLFLATYAVPPALLAPRLPPSLELDTRDGNAFVSIVAFQFLDTRVLGIGWPGYRNFPEINLRFYVHRGEDRGVVFIREFVPQRLVAWLARVLYNEPYRAANISDHCHDAPDVRKMEYWFEWQGRENRLSVTGGRTAFRPAENSEEHYFKEHHWGFGVTRRGKTIHYEVAHPVWDVFPVESYDIDLDWKSVYGPEWDILAQAKPFSTIFAQGSAVAVYPKGRLNIAG
jgi:uncharacterized protein YqjF (DUF2071 family)